MKNKDKYDLRDISYSIVSNDKYEFVVYYNFIEIHRESFCNSDSRCGAFTHWLEEEYVPDILTDKEKAYLSAVIKPFRKDVEWIEKIKHYDGGNEFIHITVKRNEDCCELPTFKKGTMYKGMEANKVYTLEELGL
nr:MAG TPA: hypothetical protein [Caudoviricetes sp.]